jgi:hypothetical protein
MDDLFADAGSVLGYLGFMSKKALLLFEATGQGSILRISTLAENFPDKFVLLNFRTNFHQKSNRCKMYLRIMDNGLGFYGILQPHT